MDYRFAGLNLYFFLLLFAVFIVNLTSILSCCGCRLGNAANAALTAIGEAAPVGNQAPLADANM